MTKHGVDSVRVKLEIGDGGGATLDFIKEQIISRFSNPILNPLEDGSFITGASRLVVTTDSFVVQPPIFPGGNIGKLAVTGTINDLVASGARPLYLTLGLILAEGFSFDALETILDSAAQALSDANCMLVAGDTKVVDQESFTGIAINTTGIGIPEDPNRNFALSNSQVGDRIIVTGSMGDHGLAVLSLREGLGFEQRVISDCTSLDSLILPLLKEFGSIHALRDPTRGGLHNALIDIAEASSTRVILDRRSIPIQREVLIGCEMLGIDPLALPNEGKMVIVVSQPEAQNVIERLKQHPLGTQSAIVGAVENSSNGLGHLLIAENNIHTVKVRPKAAALPRLC